MGGWLPGGRASGDAEAMIESTEMIIRNPRVEYRKLADGGGAVLLNLDTAAYHGVNQTGSMIWETVGDGKPVGEVVPQVAALFEDAPPALDQEVTLFIEDLVERDLLRVQPPDPEQANIPGSVERGSSG
jgi:hypothetical protein